MAEHLGRIYSAQSFTIIGAPIHVNGQGIYAPELSGSFKKIIVKLKERELTTPMNNVHNLGTQVSLFSFWGSK
jgi:hypothetical protein